MARSPASRLALLCLLALAVAMPLLPHGETTVAAKHIAFLALAAIGVLCLWFDAMAGGEQPALGTPTDLGFGAFLAVAVPSALLAVNAGMARYEAGLLLALGLTYLLALKALRTAGDVRRLYAGVLLAGVVTSLFGLDGYRAYLADDAAERLRAGYLSTPLFAHSYLAAQYLVMIFVGGLVLLYERGLAGRWRGVVAVGLLPIGAFLLVIGSRGAYLAIVFALLGHLALRARAARAVNPASGRLTGLLWRAAGFGLAGLLLLAVVTAVGWLPGGAQHALERLLAIFDPASTELTFSRLRIWTDSLAMASDHLLFGVGLGGFDTVFPSYHYALVPIPHAHNQFLHVMAEMGLAGLIAFCFVLRYALAAARKGAVVLVGDAERRPLFHAAVAALAASLAYFVFEAPLKWPEAGSLIVMLLAIATRAGCVSRTRATKPAHAWIALVLVAGLLGLVYPTWFAYGRASVLTRDSLAAQVEAATARLRGDQDAARAHDEEALSLLSRADSLFPYRAEVPILSADVLYRLGRYEEALDASNLAEARLPGTFRNLNAIGAVLMQLGRPRAAIEPLRRAVGAYRGPQAAETYLSLGRAYYETARYEEAWMVFSDLLSMHYDEVRPPMLLDAAKTLVKLDRNLEQARTLLARYAERAPDHDAAFVEEMDLSIQAMLRRPGRDLAR
ncbi:MAG: O-antigen ligase family protein [Planctomycetota bacterium]|jgi:O-antigen ligase/Tfp pilus assembly protein PilF